MPPTYLYVVLRRSLGFWIGLRLLLLVVVLVFVRNTPALLASGLLISLCMVLLTAGILLFDAKAAGEDLLLANFGFSRTQIGLRALILPMIGETLLLLIMVAR